MDLSIKGNALKDDSDLIVGNSVQQGGSRENDVRCVTSITSRQRRRALS